MAESTSTIDLGLVVKRVIFGVAKRLMANRLNLSDSIGIALTSEALVEREDGKKQGELKFLVSKCCGVNDIMTC